jgi:hypothetical protein
MSRPTLVRSEEVDIPEGHVLSNLANVEGYHVGETLPGLRLKCAHLLPTVFNSRSLLIFFRSVEQRTDALKKIFTYLPVSSLPVRKTYIVILYPLSATQFLLLAL